MMVDWRSRLTVDLQAAILGDTFWEPYLSPLAAWDSAPFGVHLGILVEPYLQFVLEGRKTIESRFSARRCAPYMRVRRGDIVLLKRSGGPVVGICQIAHVWFYRLDPQSWRDIRTEFAQALCAQDPQFWKERESASFATLMRIEHVRSITPLPWTKRDRRGWVVLHSGHAQLGLDV
jgi:hypothetical protein